jgi:hypothetical protein
LAKILCGYSSILFNCDYFPITLRARESHHPIFNVPQRKLFTYLHKWSTRELTNVDSYLLFLAMLNSSELVDFRIPAIRTDQTDSIVAQNMEYLFKTVLKINEVNTPTVQFPRFAITTDTRGLQNIQYWIDIWAEKYNDFATKAGKDYDTHKLVHKEARLEKLIKNPHKTIKDYAFYLAEWAADAGAFPTFNINNPVTGLPTSLSDYWKDIIVKAATNYQIYTIVDKDLQELLDHCEENINRIGSIYSQKLFSLLEHAERVKKNFMELGDIDLSKTKYHLLDAQDTVEEANLRAAVDSAPPEMPIRENYPTKFQYLKAKYNWDMYVKHKKEL